jgi:predicted RNA-binding protein with PIN domain
VGRDLTMKRNSLIESLSHEADYVRKLSIILIFDALYFK